MQSNWYCQLSDFLGQYSEFCLEEQMWFLIPGFIIKFNCTCLILQQKVFYKIMALYKEVFEQWKI